MRVKRRKKNQVLKEGDLTTTHLTVLWIFVGRFERQEHWVF